jgi:peroxiredoxin
MAVESNMLALGTKAPAFALPDVITGRIVTLDDFRAGPGLLVMFICRHCPFVTHVQDELARIGRDYAARGLGVVAISSNDADTHPDDRPESLQEMATQVGFTFPLCYDASQSVARAYSAACTPDFFLFDRELALAYRGQLDDSRPGNGKPLTGRDLRSAIDAVLDGRPVPEEQRRSVGCGIKWKAAR